MNYEYLSNELLKAHLKSLPEEAQKAIQSSVKERLKTQLPIYCTDDVVRQILRIGANSVINEVRGADSEPCSYLEVLTDCCNALKVTPPIRAKIQLKALDGRPYAACKYLSHIESATSTLEEVLVATVFQKTYESLTPEQKLEFDERLAQAYPEQAKSISTGLAATGGALILGNLGGFGTYMAMSSLLSTISLGTLGFGAYTAASSLLSIVLGPVGWAAFGAVLVGQLGSPDMSLLILGTTTLALASLSKPKDPTTSNAVIHAVREARRLEIENEEKNKKAVRAQFAARPKATGFFDMLANAAEEFLEDVADTVKSGYEGYQNSYDNAVLKNYEEALNAGT